MFKVQCRLANLTGELLIQERQLEGPFHLNFRSAHESSVLAGLLVTHLGGHVAPG